VFRGNSASQENLSMNELRAYQQLRMQAEARLADGTRAEGSSRPVEEMLHELQVHQIELEMQNEALRQAQIALEESRDSYVDLYEFAPVGYVTINNEGLIEQLNLAAAELLREERGKLLHRRFAGCVAVEDRDRWYGHLLRVKRHPDKLSCDFGLNCSVGEIRYVQAECLHIVADGAADTVRIALVDITERKRSEKALKHSEERFRWLADSVPVLIWVSGSDGVRSWFNRRWLEFTGRTMEQERNNGWTEGVSEDDLQRCLMLHAESIEKRCAFDVEYNLRTAQGKYHWVHDRGEPTFGPDGEFMGFVGCSVDISLRKAAQQQLNEAKDIAEHASRAKSAFLANMGHEIRTPLHLIIGLGHLLRRDLKDPVQEQRIDQLCASSDHLLDIINDVLELAKIEAQRLMLDHKDFILDAVLQKVVRMIEGRAQEKGLELSVDVAPKLRAIELNGDPLRLAQVLINLCGNAVKFTERGSVRLSVGWLAGNADAVAIRFEVTDTGIGIPLANQARLFDAFEQADSSTTRERDGTGLGLTISQRLVALMGGTILIDSDPGRGSIFSFEVVLPRATARVVAGEPGIGAPTAMNFNGMQVLLVEDHPLSQDIIFEMLEDLGCQVEVASDGAEAVNCALERNYDLILMDMQMPRMDGLAATRAIRAQLGRRTPIVALTANAFAEDRQRCLDVGMDGHLHKPVTPATLARTLAEWLPKADSPGVEPAALGSELSRALEEIPGLVVGASWRVSPERLSKYCMQLKRFLAEHGHDMSRLREYLAAGDRDAALVVAHNLYGISGLVGAGRVASLAAELQQGLKGGADDAAIASIATACEAGLRSLAEAARTLPVHPPEPAEE
jgi:PAS domain S-box-containing protein